MVAWNSVMLRALVICVSSVRAHPAAYTPRDAAARVQMQASVEIPKELRGRWTIRKSLHTPGVTCWDEKQARTLIGTALEYRSDVFVWKHNAMRSLGCRTTMVGAQQFGQDNSGSGGAVSFHDLGIDTPAVKQIEIRHADVKVYPRTMDCCNAAPGESILMKSADTLVLNLCGVFYEASRTHAVR